MGERATGTIFVDRRGFGFLDGSDASWFIPPPQLRGFFAGDVATGRVVSTGRQSHVEDLSLVRRRRRQVFGKVLRRSGKWKLEPDPKTANGWLDLADDPGLEEGSFILARLAEDGSASLQEALGPLDEGALALRRVCDRYELREAFRADAQEAAEALAGREATPRGTHRDLTGLCFLTIDGPSTRDIDDALCVLPADSEGCLRLLVAIADVAELVREGQPVDREAQARGTSTYLVGRVLPMLPPALSEGALSLLPGETRYAMVCELRLDPEGAVRSTDLYEARIRSRHRLTYAEVDGYLGGEEPADAELAEQLRWLRTTTARLGFFRQRRGGVEPTRFESEIRLDEDKEPVDVQVRRPRASHKMIELCMVAANEAVARWLADRGQSALFRVHPRPLDEKIETFTSAARHFGFEPGFGPALSPASLAAFDRQTSGTPEEAALWSVLLKSLGSARYATSQDPHFGLGATLYLHFTSPIRRYADLVVHRIVKAYVRGRRAPVDPAGLGRLGEHLNLRARLASRAQNDHHKMVAARLLDRDRDKVYGARVVAVNRAGVSVQLDSSHLRGWVPLSALPAGPYELDEPELSLRGAEGSLQCGSFLRVRLKKADPALGDIEFVALG